MRRGLIYLLLGCLVLGVIPAGAAHAELVGQWKFDESVGTIAVDVAGGDNNGTLYGEVEWRPGEGKEGGALFFNRDDITGRVEIPTTGMSASKGTLMVWSHLAEPYPTNRVDASYFFGHTTRPPYANRIQLYMDGDDTILDLGLGDSHTRRTGILRLRTERWYHVALTWDTGRYVVYMDGEKITEGSYTGLTALHHFMDIGNDGNPGQGTEAFAGLLDEVRLYDRALTADEIRTAMEGAASPQAHLSAVPTFHCIGIYWSPQEGSSDNVCQVHYRALGSTGWKEALPLWYDDRGVGGYPAGYRGSIVNLDPGTIYEIKLELLDTGTEGELIAETWSEDFPIAQTVCLPAGTTHQPLEITESGSPDGYILYTPSDGSAVIDVGHNQDYCITVDASFVIIRGFNLKGAKRHGIRLYDCHDVVIEQCDISDWSTIENDGWGNRGSAIFSDSNQLKRIIVQRNRMHHPHSDTNSWSEYRAKYGTFHPRGPRAVCYVRSDGNHVIRYNEIYSDDDHYFADCLTAGNNNFPNRDSDIYGNHIANCWDDGIEAEDDNCNVRIWGNFIEWTFVKIAVASTKIGPVYIWRNVAGVGRKDDIHHWNDVVRGGFLKTNNNGGGKIYVFHNTLLQPEQPRGVYYPLGCGRGLGWGGPMLNTMSRNNILHVHKPGGQSIHDRDQDPLGDYDYDLYNGNINAYPGAEPNGIKDVPRYDLNYGDGEFSLYSSSPGYDAGVVIPNFNDHYNGAAPDIGAHEAGSAPMEFGVRAFGVSL